MVNKLNKSSSVQGQKPKTGQETDSYAVESCRSDLVPQTHEGRHSGGDTKRERTMKIKQEPQTGVDSRRFDPRITKLNTGKSKTLQNPMGNKQETNHPSRKKYSKLDNKHLEPNQTDLEVLYLKSNV